MSYRTILSQAAVLVACLQGALPVHADTATLHTEYSSAPLPACRIDPFSDAAGRQRESMVTEMCGGDHTRLSVVSPRPVFDRPETRYTRAEFGTLSTRDIGGGVLGTIRLAWSGFRDQETGHARSDRALLAAGGFVHVYDDIDVQLNVGRQVVGVPTTRATVTSSWRPTERSMFYTEWSGTAEPGPDARRVGALWWLIPRKLSLDFGLTHLSDSAGWVDRRIRLTLTGLRF